MIAQSRKFDMPSGAVLVVTMSPFADSWALMKASLKTLKGSGLSTDDLGKSMGDVLKTPTAFAFLLDRMVDFSTSPEVEAAIWRCAHRALYIPAGSDVAFPGNKVDHSLFDDPTNGELAREDYVKIISSIMEVNCRPFLVKALSGLTRVKTVTDVAVPA